MDSIQAQVLEALRAFAGGRDMGVPITVGELPAGRGLSLTLSSGHSSAPTLAGGETVTLEVALRLKHENQRTALDLLCAAQEAFCDAQALPQGEGWQVIALRTGDAPTLEERDGVMWRYGGTLTVLYTRERREA